MSAPFVIPFNNCPTSVTVRTSSYTLPTGKYAQVYVECDSGGVFTIDGIGAVVTAAFVNVYTAATTAVSYTVPTGYTGKLFGSTTGTTTNGFLNGAGLAYFTVPNIGAAGAVIYPLGPGGSMTVNDTAGQQAISGELTPSLATHRQATFWVKSGTVISGSGNWKAVVQEYNSIT